MTTNKSSGFSMVEVLLVVAILGVISAAMASTFSMMHKQLRSGDAKISTTGLVQEIRNTLMNETQCTAMLAGQILSNTGPKNLSAVTLPSGRHLTPMTPIFDNRVMLKRIYFDRAADGGTSADGSPVLTSTLWLEAAEITVAGKDPTTFQYKPYNLGTVAFSVSGGGGSGSVKTCVAATNAQTLCTAIGGTFNPATAQCQVPTDYAGVCAVFGGTWNGSSCALASSTTTSTMNPTEMCRQLGGTWGASGCALASGSNGNPGTDGNPGGVCQNSALPHIQNAESSAHYYIRRSCLDLRFSQPNRSCPDMIPAKAIGTTPNVASAEPYRRLDTLDICNYKCIAGTWDGSCGSTDSYVPTYNGPGDGGGGGGGGGGGDGG